MNRSSWIDQLYAWVIKHRNPLVSVFIIFFILQTVLLLVGSWAIYVQDASWSFFYDIGKESGEIAVIFFVLVSIPGIVRRFGKFYKLVSILMIFRRYIGIATYLFVLIHSCFVRIVPVIATIFPMYPVEISIVFGMAAQTILFFLFITSNDLSVAKLGPWWHRIHNLIYIIVWIIFLHLALQGVSIWTVLIGSMAVAQIASFIYARRRQRIAS